MKSHVIAYRSLELLFGTHTFNFNCFFDDFKSVFTQIHCLSRVLMMVNEWWMAVSEVRALTGEFCMVEIGTLGSDGGKCVWRLIGGR